MTPSTVHCTGDCDQSGAVTVDELLVLVDVVLGSAQLSGCTAGDVNNDGQITVDEVLIAAANLLNGCRAQEGR